MEIIAGTGQWQNYKHSIYSIKTRDVGFLSTEQKGQKSNWCSPEFLSPLQYYGFSSLFSLTISITSSLLKCLEELSESLLNTQKAKFMIMLLLITMFFIIPKVLSSFQSLRIIMVSSRACSTIRLLAFAVFCQIVIPFISSSHMISDEKEVVCFQLGLLNHVISLMFLF